MIPSFLFPQVVFYLLFFLFYFIVSPPDEQDFIPISGFTSVLLAFLVLKLFTEKLVYARSLVAVKTTAPTIPLIATRERGVYLVDRVGVILRLPQPVTVH